MLKWQKGFLMKLFHIIGGHGLEGEGGERGGSAGGGWVGSSFQMPRRGDSFLLPGGGKGGD